MPKLTEEEKKALQLALIQHAQGKAYGNQLRDSFLGDWAPDPDQYTWENAKETASNFGTDLFEASGLPTTGRAIGKAAGGLWGVATTDSLGLSDLLGDEIYTDEEKIEMATEAAMIPLTLVGEKLIGAAAKTPIGKRVVEYGKKPVKEIYQSLLAKEMKPPVADDVVEAVTDITLPAPVPGHAVQHAADKLRLDLEDADTLVAAAWSTVHKGLPKNYDDLSEAAQLSWMTLRTTEAAELPKRILDRIEVLRNTSGLSKEEVGLATRKIHELEAAYKDLFTSDEFVTEFNKYQAFQAANPGMRAGQSLQNYHLSKAPHEIKLITAGMRKRVDDLLKANAAKGSSPYGKNGELYYVKEDVLKWLDALDNAIDSGKLKTIDQRDLELIDRVSARLAEFENKYTPRKPDLSLIESIEPPRSRDELIDRWQEIDDTLDLYDPGTPEYNELLRERESILAAAGINRPKLSLVSDKDIDVIDVGDDFIDTSRQVQQALLADAAGMLKTRLAKLNSLIANPPFSEFYGPGGPDDRLLHGVIDKAKPDLVEAWQALNLERNMIEQALNKPGDPSHLFDLIRRLESYDNLQVAGRYAAEAARANAAKAAAKAQARDVLEFPIERRRQQPPVQSPEGEVHLTPEGREWVANQEPPEAFKGMFGALTPEQMEARKLVTPPPIEPVGRSNTEKLKRIIEINDLLDQGGLGPDEVKALNNELRELAGPGSAPRVPGKPVPQTPPSRAERFVPDPNKRPSGKLLFPTPEGSGRPGTGMGGIPKLTPEELNKAGARIARVKELKKLAESTPPGPARRAVESLAAIIEDSDHLGLDLPRDSTMYDTAPEHYYYTMELLNDLQSTTKIDAIGDLINILKEHPELYQYNGDIFLK